MAATSVVDWATCLKPLLSASYSSFNHNQIPNLADAIISSEADILQHEDKYDAFYGSFVALSSHYISQGAGSLSKSQLAPVAAACKVLLRSLIECLQNQDSSKTQKHTMILIRSVCRGCSSLPKSDVVTFTAQLKSALTPPSAKSSLMDAEEKKEKPMRLNSDCNIFSQLTAVFDDLPPHAPSPGGRSTPGRPAAAAAAAGVGGGVVPVETVNLDGDTTIVHLVDPEQETRAQLASRNVQSLQQLNGADALLDVCGRLTHLQPLVQAFQAAAEGGGGGGGGLGLPSTLADASAAKARQQGVLGDVALVQRLFTLPVLEPLTPSRLQKVVSITMGCLQAAVSATVVTGVVSMGTGTQVKGASFTKEEEMDTEAIVQKALEIFYSVAAAIKSSTRVGGQCLQNLNLLGAWGLLKGLQHLVTLTPSGILEKQSREAPPKSVVKGPTDTAGGGGKGKEPPTGSTRPGSAKSPAGFGPLPVALATHALGLLTSLMEDLRLEGLVDRKDDPGSVPVTLNLSTRMDTPYPALHRVLMLTRAVDFIGLLANLLSVSFRKAVSLKKPHLSVVCSDPASSDSGGSSSDSNTYYDDFSSSEDSSADEDDDSEPILGQWFEETLSPEDGTSSLPPPPPPPAPGEGHGVSTPEGKHPHRMSSLELPCLLPDKQDADGFICLATEILRLMNEHYLLSAEPDIQNYLRAAFNEQHMSLLASIILDVDGQPHTEVETILSQDFSAALAKFTHSLIASYTLSDGLQDTLLHHLGVSPSAVDPWPLHVPPRVLAVLAEVLLLRQQTKRESSAKDMAVEGIWTRLCQTFVNSATSVENAQLDTNDLNVEHAQLLLFLFHGLPMVQRRVLLLQVCQCVIRIADVFQKSAPGQTLEGTIPLPLSRLMVLIDYLLHFFYDHPPMLMEQVQYNLFGAFAGLKTEARDGSSSKKFYPFKEVEDNYRKGVLTTQPAEKDLRPRFYNLCPADFSTQDTPKVDGLACSFILSNPDVLDYNAFYDAMICLLAAGSRCDRATDGSFTPLAACSVQYHFLVTWRVLSCLPPSAQYVTSLESTQVPSKATHVLHALRWIPRLAHKAFQGWTKDFLVKQGLMTQRAEALVSGVVKATSSVTYDIGLVLGFIQSQISVMPLVGRGEILPPSEMPSLSTVYMLDAVLAKIQVSLDDHFNKSVSEIDPHKAMKIAQELLPATFLLIEAYLIYIRSCVLGQLSAVGPGTQGAYDTVLGQVSGEGGEALTPAALQAYGAVLSLGSSRCPVTASLATGVMGWLPNAVRNAVDKMTSINASEFPAVGAWRNAYANDIVPVEGYVDAILHAHLATLSNQAPFTLLVSLKHVLHALVRFCSDQILCCPDDDSSNDMVRVVFPLKFDATTEYLADFVTLTLERILGPSDGEAFVGMIYEHVLGVCHKLVLELSATESCLDERVLRDCLTFMETHMEKPAGKVAISQFFSHNADLVGVLLSAASDHLSPAYGTKVLLFFNRLFQLAEKNPSDKSYEAMCMSLIKLASLDASVLQNWLSKMIMNPSQSIEDVGRTQENRLLLQSLTSYIVKDNSHVGEEVAKAILGALVPMGSQILSPTSEGIGFSELMVVMANLAGAGTGSGHVTLFQAATGWLELCKAYLAQANVMEKLTEGEGKHQTMLESTIYLLSYIGDILGALKVTSERAGVSAPPYEGDLHAQEGESDWGEDLAREEDDSMAEDSDEESLNNKLCTFTVTQREYMNQHWYHCHTCKIVEGIGVCSVCAKVCHKDHDLTYAKYGSFFCDCGAKTDGSCIAMVRRSTVSGLDGSGSGRQSGSSPFSMETMLTSSLRRRLSSPAPGADRGQTEGAPKRDAADRMSKARETLCKQMEGFKDIMANFMKHSKTVGVVLELLEALMPGIADTYGRLSPVGSMSRAQQTLDDLKKLPKTVETTETLMTATLGSQEGAFENVRMNYSGDQGQTIRQLITSHVLRRVAMCCLTSPQGKRQHLAVSHEKGKITILQLSALLRQADSSKRKLTLTRLASAPIPFTVLTIAGNPCNEDYLVVCGLKDCHVLTFTSSGSVADHLVLHPSLETGNFIIKALWLPGSQTELAIITADFVKIYDLAVDALSPQYYFLLPSGKVRDAAFISADDCCHLVLMASSGFLYTQTMNDVSAARHGPFYITNVVEAKHPDLNESSSLVAGGGVSLYFSHALQLLFFSYANGKTFAAPVSRDVEKLPRLFPINFKSSNGGKAGAAAQPLVQWTEVPNHPGLVSAMTQASNTPVVMMVKPSSVLVQEIKVLPAKAKIQDMVAIRHSGSNSDQRTTLILLCEDGSLRIYMANQDQTSFWMSPSLQPQNAIAVLKPSRKKKTVAQTGKSLGHVTFPVDYFEHCQQSNDTEFGGNDVLQVYNTSQVKHRLNTTGMYIASTKTSGFTIEIQNTNSSMVIVGIRVLVGSQSLERIPSSLEVFGRSTPITHANLTRSRWFDLPFTREESLTTHAKVALFVGPSSVGSGVTMVDSIKVYVKTKDMFGWPEDHEELPDAGVQAAKPPAAGGVATAPVGGGVAVGGVTSGVPPGFLVTEADGSSALPAQLTAVDRLLANSLEVLDGCFASSLDDQDAAKTAALSLTIRLLTLPIPLAVQQPTKSLLAALFNSRQVYHTHKDGALLSHVLQCLAATRDGRDVDADTFQRLVLTARSVAVARPANLVRFTERNAARDAVLEVTDLEEEPEADHVTGGDDARAALSQFMCLEAVEIRHFATQLLDIFWRLHAARPSNAMIAPVCLPGLTHVEATVGALVEVIHAFAATDPENVALAAKLYMRLLISEHTQVSFACKQTLIRVLRSRQKRKRVFIPSPPRCSTPGVGADDEDEEEDKAKTHGGRQGAALSEEAPPQLLPPSAPHQPAVPPHPQVQPPPPDDDALYDVEPMVLEAVGHPQHPHHPQHAHHPQHPGGALAALLAAGGAHFPAMLDIPPDADDETMVELAIALSLQEQSTDGGATMRLDGFSLSAQREAGSLEAGQLSDTTASAPGSDDEAGSTAATDGSTLRTSPAEHGGSAGSESGGSNVDSVSVSGRSSAYGDTAPESTAAGVRSETSSVGLPSTAGMHQEGEVEGEEADPTDGEVDLSQRLHGLRLQLLERLTSYMGELRHVGGVRAIPYMQVVLMLTSDLDSEEDRDKAALDALLTALMGELDMGREEVASKSSRTPNHEVQLVILRLLSVLMSRTKAGTKPSAETSSSFLSTSTGAAMLSAGGLDYCLKVLKALLEFWRNTPTEEPEGSVVPGQLLKPRPTSPPPDMSPFFLRQYVKGHAGDIFEDYPRLLTEMVLRLPYQMKKIADSAPNVTRPTFDLAWFHVLAEYLMTQQAPFVRRQVRKLLLYICGSKDKYRQLRDLHILEANMKQIRAICEKGGFGAGKRTVSAIILPYDVLITLIEHLKSCSEVATTRAVNWQLFCQRDEGTLPFLIHASILLDEGVSSVILQLLQGALCGSKATAATSSASSSKHRKDKEKSEKEKEGGDPGVKQDDSLLSLALVQQITQTIDRSLFIHFVRCFLLESNNTAVRWQAHALILHMYRSSPLRQQEGLVDQMWTIWPELPTYGRKAAQFVDLLGYFAIKTPQSSEKKAKQCVEQAVSVLRAQNKILANHPNGSLYNMLQGVVDFDGYYLESDPCLVCNNPEVPCSNMKLASIKVDSKFTTTTQIVKLVGSFTIGKINVRISDLKRTKMVRTMIFYYTNRSVQAVVELKNKAGLWHKARKVVLAAGQTEVKVEFPLPIVACNLMVEYADFYDNLQASTETLQCPRCSATVPANPGVCGNCGENVFQCHKCRGINYDEKDPFLCNACGFCKYAKFDVTLSARPCCAVDPIEGEEDRKKAVSNINSLLEKADRLYKQLQLNKPTLEALLVKEDFTFGTAGPQGGGGGSGPAGGASNVNRSIYQVAQRYCGDCRNTFDDLSKIIQKVLATRKELVEYDRQQRESAAAAAAALPCSTPTTPTVSPRVGELFHEKEPTDVKPKERLSRCYGCASATVEYCITLLRALSTNPNLRSFLYSQGLIRELVEYNLRRGTGTMRADVRQLLGLLTKDNAASTEQLNALILRKVIAAIAGHVSNTDFAGTVRHEMQLLAATVQREDSCWELRVRSVWRLFLFSIAKRSPTVLESVSLPCLRIINLLIRPAPPASKKHKEKTTESLTTVKTSLVDLHVDAKAWLAGDQAASFQAWKKNMPVKALDLTSKKRKDEKPREREMERRIGRVKYLMEKYGYRWLDTTRSRRGDTIPLRLMDRTWLRHAIFSPSSMATRQMACNVVESLCQTNGRKKEILDVLTSYLEEVGKSGEAALEYLNLFKRILSADHWKFYLALKGVLLTISQYISQEIEVLNMLEATTLNSDLSQGFALKALTELLASFLEQDAIRQHYKSRLVGTVLDGFLSLKKLVVQRTKLIDETQDKLLELLEEMTTGKESETREFMAVCVQTVDKYPLSDFLSPVFIFERLCSIIYPEENDVAEFFLTLEKDPQQEDFLQGRMLGNPYSWSEPGLGPLMRDVKNKICQDCELVALLEDDTGMELLVCNKIISLDLPVKDVFKKIWCQDHGEGEAMRVVYRMRGLLGDATEDMVNTLDSGKDEDVDNEEVYKMANVMYQCGGLRVMLQRLAGIRDLVSGKQLMQVILKLFSFCVKVKVNRQQLIQPVMNTISIMLGALNLALLAEQESGASTKGQTLTEQILQIMETILMEASHQSPDLYKEFSNLCGDKDQLMVLLDRINSPFVRANPGVLQALMRLIPFLAFGDQDKMQTLVNHFLHYLDFNKYDFEHSEDEQVHIECFCVIAQGIETNANGRKLKDLIADKGIVNKCLDYIQMHAPEIRTMLATDSDNWKEFITKPALAFALRLLTGLSNGHEYTQMLVSRDVIPILHKLEQVSSDEHIGTLAENLMDVLKGHPQVVEKVEEVRMQTRMEKKRLAMAMRQKQLGALGMTTNEKGQVTVKSSVLKQMEDLKEETGLVCCICREGYRYQATKVLGIYTFTKRVNLEDYELKSRKVQGYSTVSHFNIVHVDCHLAAVRHARGREEWDSAALQNGNTRCNGLLPLWGPQVPESAFANCLARHNTYLQECTGARDANYSYTVHDLKHLLLKFALEKSFSEDSGGGGRESNVLLVPYIIHMGLYVLNTTRSFPREEKTFAHFIKTPREKWLESAFDTEGPLYYVAMTPLILARDKWKASRVAVLKRLLVLAQARATQPAGGASLLDKTVKEYSVYKPYLLFFALVDGIHNIVFAKCATTTEPWPQSLADYIRFNDQTLQEVTPKLLRSFEDETLPCESLAEFCDVTGLLEDIPDPDGFLAATLASVP